MDAAHYFIKNTTSSWLVALILLIGGSLSYLGLGQLEDPQFTLKQAMVITSYPGASPQQVEEEVSYPLENAIQQLQANSAQSVFFSTALSVQHAQSGFESTIVEHYQVQFRPLTLAEIERYIALDAPLHCAGSFKCESLGISLFEKMHGDDQTTLMGLPMIQLCKILREFGLSVP